MWIVMNLARELHRGVIRKFKTRKIIVKGIDHIWEGDLLIMSNYSRQNRGFKYILNVIDCFSKYAWGIPLKSKSGAEVSKAFESIIKKGRKPELFHADRGKEFVNSTFKKLLSKHRIEIYHTFSEVKAAMVERFNRTINEKLKLHFEVNKNHKWLDILPKIYRQYNNIDVHRTIGVPPGKVTKKNQREIYARMYPLDDFGKPTKPVFQIGDRVRITRKKEVFGNKYGRKWTTEIFVISKIHYTVPITYAIQDMDGEPIDGKFYKYELQKTKL